MSGYLALHFGERGATIELHRNREAAADASEAGVREVAFERFAAADAPAPVRFTPADQAWRELRPLFGEV